MTVYAFSRSEGVTKDFYTVVSNVVADANEIRQYYPNVVSIYSYPIGFGKIATTWAVAK